MHTLQQQCCYDSVNFYSLFLLSLSAAIELRIDRRCTLAELKTRLEEYVQVPSSEFKVPVQSLKFAIISIIEFSMHTDLP